MTAKVAQRDDPSLLLVVVYQDDREVYRIRGLPQMSATKMAAALNSHDDLLKRLIMSQEAFHHAMATARGDLLADLQTQFAANRAAIARAEE